MKEYQSLSHTRWDCKYHVVFIPKWRKKRVFGVLRKHLGEMFHELASYKEAKIVEGHLMGDHVHICISIPPKYAASNVVGYLKGKSAIQIARKFGARQKNFTGENFWARGYVELLKKMMKYRKKPIHLVLDSLPAHKTALVKKYVTATEGRLTLHFLPGYAPDLNPDELVWSHVKRTGTARRPLQKGEKLRDKIEEQLAALQKLPLLVRSFFKAPSVAYIGDC